MESLPYKLTLFRENFKVMNLFGGMKKMNYILMKTLPKSFEKRNSLDD